MNFDSDTIGPNLASPHRPGHHPDLPGFTLNDLEKAGKRNVVYSLHVVHDPDNRLDPNHDSLRIHCGCVLSELDC